MAVAMEWVSRIIAISLEMVLPGLGGQWLDRRWGTQYLALLGFALGISFAIWHLIALTQQDAAGNKPNSDDRNPEQKSDDG